MLHDGSYWLQSGEFPKGSVSMRTRSSVILYLSAGRAGEGGRGRGGQVTRPALVSQFGNILRGVGEGVTVKCQPNKAFSLELN